MSFVKLFAKMRGSFVLKVLWCLLKRVSLDAMRRKRKKPRGFAVVDLLRTKGIFCFREDSAKMRGVSF